jgi:hypothetical protein
VLDAQRTVGLVPADGVQEALGGPPAGVHQPLLGHPGEGAHLHRKAVVHRPQALADRPHRRLRVREPARGHRALPCQRRGDHPGASDVRADREHPRHGRERPRPHQAGGFRLQVDAAARRRPLHEAAVGAGAHLEGEPAHVGLPDGPHRPPRRDRRHRRGHLHRTRGHAREPGRGSRHGSSVGRGRTADDTPPAARCEPADPRGPGLGPGGQLHRGLPAGGRLRRGHAAGPAPGPGRALGAAADRGRRRGPGRRGDLRGRPGQRLLGSPGWASCVGPRTRWPPAPPS